MKNFSSVDQAFETPMDSLLYKWVKGPLAKLLGGKFYYTRIAIQCGYTLGKHGGVGFSTFQPKFHISFKGNPLRFHVMVSVCHTVCLLYLGGSLYFAVKAAGSETKD